MNSFAVGDGVYYNKAEMEFERVTVNRMTGIIKVNRDDYVISEDIV